MTISPSKFRLSKWGTRYHIVRGRRLERLQKLDEFLDAKGLEMLVCSMRLGTGFNMQQGRSIMVLMSIPDNVYQPLQIVGHQHRLSQKSERRIHILGVVGSHDGIMQAKAYRRMILESADEDNQRVERLIKRTESDTQSG